jgi:hypothetical protein
LNFGESTMAKKSCRKRPCCICRKWFQPDVRQKDRQKTCGRSECKDELHRRNCHNWNKRNKEYFANNYLDKKIAQVEKKAPVEDKKDPPPHTPPFKATNVIMPTSPFVLPAEVIVREYGVKSLIIIHYLARKIVTQLHCLDSGIP